MNDLYRKSIVADSLLVCNWNDEILDKIRGAGITVFNATVAIWEDFAETCKNIAALTSLIASRPDYSIARNVADIHGANAANKTVVIFGFQNASPIEGNLDSIPFYRELGVGIIQLTYNNQNFIGSGVYESRDSGLSDFGREAVLRMNAAGIAIDLSHVGPLTSQETVAASRAPVCYSHANPKALKDHVRNKTDKEIKAVLEKGGYLGVNLSPIFMPAGANKAVEHIVVMLDYLFERFGDDQIGIGTDLTEGHDEAFWTWIMKVNGSGQAVFSAPYKDQEMVLRSVSDYPSIADVLARHGYSDSRIEKIIGRNFVDYMGRVWDESDA